MEHSIPMKIDTKFMEIETFDSNNVQYQISQMCSFIQKIWQKTQPAKDIEFFAISILDFLTSRLLFLCLRLPIKDQE